MSKKILVTGADGDLGKVIVGALKKDNFVLEMVLDKKTADQIQGNLLNPGSLEEATKNIDVVVHCAALIEGKKKNIWRTNALGTQNLIQACKKNKVKKIIFISSYDIRFDSVYGRSKLRGEEIIKESKLDYVILRPTVIYGKNFKRNLASLANMVKKYPLIPVIGDGNNLYQPVSAMDIARIIEKIIFQDRFNNSAYYLAGPTSISMNSLISLISKKMNKRIIKFHLPKSLAIIIFGKKFTDKTVGIKDLNTSRKELGIEFTSIEQGINDLI
ncbi:hypothetical protein A3K73_07370 [Candidatus Pacearchaeota archaeon RBG_13_36_9]|nr:MAG: hypothetical protein A3K73_07370 [Candidatus Pacearchaeota archaeon RBG_13_36_9]